MSCVPVLMYHHVAPDREVTPAGFDAQLRRLKADGWRSLTGVEMLAHLEGRAEAPAKSLMLTFDDGYADNWVYAYPSLKRHGFKATIFVVTSRLGSRDKRRPRADEGGKLEETRSRERAPEGFLDWSEARAMAESGVIEIGSHTETHRGFNLDSAFDLGELERSRLEIERRLGLPCRQLAWPWGHHEEAWVDAAAKAGYELVHTTVPGPNEEPGDPLRVRRFKVQKDDVDWLVSRLAIYSSPWMGRLYGSLYGLDRALKAALKR